MSLLDLFQWFEYSSLLVAMRSSPWLFPVIATIHLLGLAVLGGAVLIVDLRLLGLGLSRQLPAQLARDAEPLLLGSLLVMLLTGLLLFMCFATKYYYLTAFWVKLASLFLAVVFTFTIRRRVITGGETRMRAIWSRPTAVVSVSLWTSVVLTGRLIGFP
ncbi:MAG: DUF6644 family protein [Gammaproteobacteria bacterium]